MPVKLLSSITKLKNKRVLLRLDLNINFDSLEYNTRLIESLPTIKFLLDKGAFVTIISHKGRPVNFSKNYSLYPLVNILESSLNEKVFWQPDWPVSRLEHSCRLELAENTRFLDGEVNNDLTLAQKMSQGYDLFVMDAFGCAHRAHASTCGVAAYIPASIGLLVEKELDAVTNILNNNYKSITLVVGGAKIESKLPLLAALMPFVKNVLVGGGVANTLLVANGLSVGKSLYDKDFVEEACNILHDNFKVKLPLDVICSDESMQKSEQKFTDVVDSNDMILDIGSRTWESYAGVLDKSDAIIWAGPLGLVENDMFSLGTKQLCKYMAKTNAFTFIGGGDTVACMNQLYKHGLKNINVISTGGGAFLAALTGNLAAFKKWKLYEKN